MYNLSAGPLLPYANAHGRAESPTARAQYHAQLRLFRWLGGNLWLFSLISWQNQSPATELPVSNDKTEIDKMAVVMWIHQPCENNATRFTLLWFNICHHRHRRLDRRSSPGWQPPASNSLRRFSCYKRKIHFQPIWRHFAARARKRIGAHLLMAILRTHSLSNTNVVNERKYAFEMTATNVLLHSEYSLLLMGVKPLRKYYVKGKGKGKAKANSNGTNWQMRNENKTIFRKQ